MEHMGPGPLVRWRVGPKLSREPQPMPSCVGARLMPMVSGRAARPASGRRGQEGGWHKGKLAGGLHFRWPLMASQGGYRCSAGPVPWKTLHLLTCFLLQEEMPGLSNRELPGACCPLSIHLLWLQPPPPQGWFLPTARTSQASDAHLSSSLPHTTPSPSCL